MIFYFSGTGNSLAVTKTISTKQKEEFISIAALMSKGNNEYKFNLKENETIGFIYPVYAWAPPKMVLNFISKLTFSNYNKNYTFSIATCGENIGNTMKVLSNSLNKKGITLNSGFSITMPNNYIILGNTDSKEIVDKKLRDAEAYLEKINGIIRDKKQGVYELEKGILPSMLTNVINPMFNKHAMDTTKFSVSDKCTSCKLCEKICNCNNITVADKPKWGNKCSQCLACIHYCPVEAIQYGKNSNKKGRYTNPDVSPAEMIIK